MKHRFIGSRILSGFLTAAMVVTMAPQTALSSFAEEVTAEEEVVTETVSGENFDNFVEEEADTAFFDAS